MEKSENITNLTKALIVFDAEIGKIAKANINPFFKNAYADLPSILEAIKEPLQKSGLTIKQFPEGDFGLTTIIFHAESGEFISSSYNMKAVKDDPQQQGSRITYQRRYAIGAVLGLNIDVDDDGNNASHNTQQKQWLSQKQFEAILSRIKEGEKGLITKTLNEFLVKNEYKIGLETAEKNS